MDAENSGLVFIDEIAYRMDRSHFYPDGNVIFLVEGMAYKLLKSIMARHSTVMKDMFDLPQESTDGTVPAIQLDDNRHNFSLLLAFIIPMAPPRQYNDLKLEEVLHLLHMTQKYGMDPFHQSLLGVCRSLLPYSIPTLSRLQAYESLDIPCAVILATRTVTGLEKYLPLAYYVLATREWDDFSPMMDKLPAEAKLAICLGGRNLLQETIDHFREADSDFVRTRLMIDSFQCERPECSRAKRRGKIIIEGWRFDSIKNPLEELVSRIPIDQDPETIQGCSIDCKAADLEDQRLLELLFGSLPRIFKLDNSAHIVNSRQ